MPKISFLLPIYNGETFLSETMDSLLAQSHDDFDIVVIDDGSTDGTANVIHGYDDARIKYHHKENGGLVSALNMALGMMDCELVARIDADDICAPDRLARQAAFMAFTQAVAVSGRAVNIDPSGNVLGINAPELDFFQVDAGFIPAREPYLPHPFFMARLDVLKDIGGFRHAHLAEDTDLCWRLSQVDRIALQTAVLGKYRVHETSISNASTKGGRVQAFYSQLATLNAVRRDAGQAEVPYAYSMNEIKAVATGFDALVDLFGDALSDGEAVHLRAASVMKYLDISNWRYHKITAEDLTYARAALAAVELSDANKEKVEQILTPLKVRQPELFG
jgi:glycosyltransferase involved in cell wall biosynthesis